MENPKDLEKQSAELFETVLRVKDLSSLQQNKKLRAVRDIFAHLNGTLFDFDAPEYVGFGDYLEEIGFRLSENQKNVFKRLAELSNKGSINESLFAVKKELVKFGEKVVSELAQDEKLLFGRHGEILPELCKFLESNWRVFHDDFPHERLFKLKKALQYYNMQIEFIANNRLPEAEKLKELKNKQISFERSGSILSDYYPTIRLFAQRRFAKGELVSLQAYGSREAFLADSRRDHFKDIFDRAQRNSDSGFVYAVSLKKI